MYLHTKFINYYQGRELLKFVSIFVLKAPLFPQVVYSLSEISAVPTEYSTVLWIIRINLSNSYFYNQQT